MKIFQCVYYVISFLLIAMGLSACSSDDSGLPPNDDINGVWRDQNTDMVALISSRGNRVNILGPFWGDEQYEGRILARDGLIYESFLSYFVTSGGYRYITKSVEGTVVPKLSINVLYDNGKEFSLLYDAISDRPDSIDRISGIWGRTSGDYTITYSIDDSGNLSGSDTYGLVYAGKIVADENNFNIYSVEEFSIHDPDGYPISYFCCYEGQAAVIDTNIADDTLVFGVIRIFDSLTEELFRQ
jgi:hypothetical protein